MHTKLLVSIFNENLVDKFECDFFQVQDLNEMGEAIFLSKIKELFELIRDKASGVSLNFFIETKEKNELIFLLNKAKNKPKSVLNLSNPKLTNRENEVLALIMSGFTNSEIAAKLFVSFETVKSHRKNILEKTGAKNTANLFTYYQQTFFEK